MDYLGYAAWPTNIAYVVLLWIGFLCTLGRYVVVGLHFLPPHLSSSLLLRRSPSRWRGYVLEVRTPTDESAVIFVFLF